MASLQSGRFLYEYKYIKSHEAKRKKYDDNDRNVSSVVL